MFADGSYWCELLNIVFLYLVEWSTSQGLLVEWCVIKLLLLALACIGFVAALLLSVRGSASEVFYGFEINADWCGSLVFLHLAEEL